MKTSRPLAAVLLGLIGTLVVLGAFWAGLDTGPELSSLDMRFALTDAKLPDNILHIDIDDGSLELVGRWPWPREELAAIIDVLTECGAKAVMVDLILNEYQKERFENSANDMYEGGEAELISGEAPPRPIFDDMLLASALYRAGNVYLVTHINLSQQSSATLDTYHAVSRFMSDKSVVDLRAVRQDVPGDRLELSKAYLRRRSTDAMKRFAINPGLDNAPIQSGQISPPLVTFVEAAAGIGCVTYVPDPDKMVRRIPLLFKGDETIYPQFAAALAINLLSDKHGGLEALHADESGLSICFKNSIVLRVPLDSEGSMMIRWPRQAIGTDTYGLEHIPAATLAKIWMERNALRLNSDRLQILRSGFMDLGQELPEGEEIKKLYWAYPTLAKQYNESYDELIAYERTLNRTILFSPSVAPDRAKLLELRSRKEDIQDRLESTLAALTSKLRTPGNLEVFLGKPKEDAATQPAEVTTEHQEYLKRLERSKEQLAIETQLLDKNRELERNIALLINELKPKIAGKICMLGATSSGVPDFVPTPLGPMTPGVMVHSHIINTMLSGQFVYPAGMLANTITILLAGVLVSLLAATRPILQAAPLSLLAAIGYAVLNALVLFAWWGIWLAMAAPLAAMLISFLFVTGFRQLTEERAKRQIRDRFAKSLSPALVEQLLSDPELASPGGRSTELTCMFSDLAGFTPLSESLGPQETVKLLNRYFDGVTDIVQNQCGGYLNKFLGDGLFVLFGVPIKLSDHPSRAIDAALMCQKAVADLNEALASEMDREITLKVRIGIHSGQAMFGNCGSTEREDYTAIGDCVNLSARLESANKFFGTRIIVSRHAWGLCDREEILTRPLGRVFITGVKNPLNLLEVVGPIDEIDTAHKKAITHFAKAMELIANRKFAEARTELKQAAKLRPDDLATETYIDICDQCVAWGEDINAWPAEAVTSGGVVRLAWPERI